MKTYLVDTMVLSSPRFKSARLLKENGTINYRVIEEISWETRHNKEFSDIIQRESEDNITDIHVKFLSETIESLINRSVVKINEGCGDAMLVAEYLYATNQSQTSLFGTESNIIVTNDKRLAKYCSDSQILFVDSEEFFNQIQKLINQ